MLIDTHCHLDFEDFDKDREGVIKRAREGGIGKIINIGCNLERAKKSLEIANKYEFVFATCGLHPQEAGLGNEIFFSELEKLLKEPKVVAIGECGLEILKDRPWNFQGRSLKKQKEVFIRQLNLAHRFNKPVIIHCRNAYSEILEVLEEEKEKNPKLSGVVHFFAGRSSQAEEFLKLGFLLSFTGVVTFARDYDGVIKAIPLDKIIIETDAPFVAPIPYRGQRNEPLYAKYVAFKLAELKGLNFNEVAVATTKNAENLFEI